MTQRASWGMRQGDSIIQQRMCLVFLPPERIMPRNIQEGICPSGWGINSARDGSCAIRTWLIVPTRLRDHG
ncbi:hypothetical protein BB934_40420 (plasmid) [Microvirga ossetica]|uniref:Uncharacterized protein n=1 Tax=Microvirga ossetica TaxID=1882682 RepID=A0A1B2EWY4_9HYPH|nr:hypothetical protein BB934_40420 [Microvirga ossetica]